MNPVHSAPEKRMVSPEWLAYWCGNCAKRETKSTRMCSKPRLRTDDFGELRCSRYKNELCEWVIA